jgi:NAD(P)H-hydrate epimerase
VIDADALTILAEHPGNPLGASAGPRLLTPHPGEMERLVPGSSAKPRKEIVRDFIRRQPATLLLKGARTLVGTHGHPLSFNSTGHPAMASGGMGDVLTGVCTGLLAQGLSCHDAARLGAWLCGRSAEIVLARGSQSAESLLAGDVADALGEAFESLQPNAF